MDDPYTNQNTGQILQLMAAELIAMIGLVWAVVKLVGGFFPVLGAIIFAVGTYFPFFCFFYTLHNRYINSADQRRSAPIQAAPCGGTHDRQLHEG